MQNVYTKPLKKNLSLSMPGHAWLELSHNETCVGFVQEGKNERLKCWPRDHYFIHVYVQCEIKSPRANTPLTSDNHNSSQPTVRHSTISYDTCKTDCVEFHQN